MPIFVDVHDHSPLSDEEWSEVEDLVRSGTPDRHGVVNRAVVRDKATGMTYCILEGPDEAAIVRHHESAGIPGERDSLHEAEEYLPDRPASDD